MEKLIAHTKRFIFAKQKDILSSAVILALMIIISRVFGFMRYRTLAGFFSKEELDLFLASFRLPDFVFEVLVTGALTSAFIPIFIKYEKNTEELNKTISTIVNFIMLGLTLFVVFVFLFAGIIIPFITPGFSHEKIKFITGMSQLLLITQLPLLVMGNILSGIGQANKTFILTAIAPILYNLGIIAGTLLLSRTLWIQGPIIGVIIGSLLFVVVQIPILFSTPFRYTFLKFDKKILKEFVSLFLPRLFSVVTAQIDVTVDLTLATLLGAGSYTIFFFAQHLQFFPVSFIGMAFGQASVPYLADLFKENKIMEIRKIFIDSCLQLLFLTIPISLLFIFARTPITRLFFGGEKFDWDGTVLTAKTMSFFALSIPFHSLFYFITRAFYAGYDSKTPFIVNSLSVIVNVLISVVCIFYLHLPVWSMAIAFSIAITANVFILFYLFYKKIGGYNIMHLIVDTSKIYLASTLAALMSYPLMKILDIFILDTSRTINIFFLLVITTCFFSVAFLFFCWLFAIKEVSILTNLFFRMKDIKKKPVEINTDTG
jgi:putative peptidoglycan lipid II flippase